jgi:hypothetical protein
MLTEQLFLARPSVTQMSNDVHLLGVAGAAGVLAGALPPSLCQPCHSEKKGRSNKTQSAAAALSMPDNPPSQPTKKAKYWGKAEKAYLTSLVNTGDVNIFNSSLENIESVRKEHFLHCGSKNFHNNFRNFAAVWALESEYAGARLGEEAGGKSARLYLSYYSTLVKKIPFSSSRETTDSKRSNVADNDANAHKVTDAHKAALEEEMTEMYQPAAAAAKPPADKKKTASAVVAIPAPVKKIVLYYLDTRDTSVVAYYQDDGVGYAEVALYINGVVPKGTYRFTVAKDVMSVSWQRAIHKRCFDKKLLQGIMKDKYSSSHSCVIAYDNVLQEMHFNRLTPDASGLYWGAPQVIRLSKKVTGLHLESVHPYPTKVKIQGATQYNTLAHCRLMLERQRIKASAPAHYRVIDLFGLQSSQESDDDHQEPPYSPPKRSRNTDAHVVTSRRRSQNAYIDDEANVHDERDLDADYNGGGKHGYHD